MPQTGNFQLIELYRSPNPATVPVLLEGEPAVTIAPAATKFWLGDGTAARLLLSTDDGDAPLATAAYLKRNGGALTGAVTTNQTTFANTALVTKQYVDDTVAAGQMLQGNWDVPGNDPDLSAVSPSNGFYWIVSVAGTSPAFLSPGITTGTMLNIGDHIRWNGTSSEWERTPAGGMTQAEADARYLQLAGGTMANTPTPAVITMGAGYTPTASTQQVATMNALAAATTGMLTAVVTDGSLTGNGTSGTPLRVLAVNGGVF